MSSQINVQPANNLKDQVMDRFSEYQMCRNPDKKERIPNLYLALTSLFRFMALLLLDFVNFLRMVNTTYCFHVRKFIR
jgi:hypothetical protein